MQSSPAITKEEPLDTTMPTTKERKKNSSIFRFCYEDLCKIQNSLPLAGIKAHLMKDILDFNGDRIKLDDWGPIIMALGLDRSLHFIAIRSRHPSKKAMNDIDSDVKARGITKRPVLLTRYILYMLMDALAQCLSKSNALTCLELEGLPLADDYLGIICSGIAECKSLQNLSFYKSPIGDEGCKEVCVIIRNLPNVISLDLSKCDITAEGASMVSEVIKYQSLQRYSESWKQTLRYRNPNLESMPGLRRITLNHNTQIGNQGVMYLTEALKDDLWIRALDLQNCGVNDTGGQYVSDMLELNNTLHIVDLRGNRRVDEETLRHIMCKLAQNNTNLSHEYQWISLEPQLLKAGSHTSFLSRPSSYTNKGSRPNMTCKTAVPSNSKSTLQRAHTVSFANNAFKKNGPPRRVDVRMNQRQMESTEKKMKEVSGVPQIHKKQEFEPPLPRNPPPSPESSICDPDKRLKVEALVERLVREVTLRKEAELQNEELNQQIQRLVSELKKEQEEKQGFCLLKVEAFEAIQGTLNKFVDFMKKMKKPQVIELFSQPEQYNDQQSDGEQDIDISVAKKSHSAHVKRNVPPPSEQSKASKSTSGVYPGDALVQNVETQIGDCIKPTTKSKKSRKPSAVPGSHDLKRLQSKKSQNVDDIHSSKIQKSMPSLSDSLSGDLENSSETESIHLRNRKTPSLPLVAQMTKVQEIFEGLVSEQRSGQGELSADFAKKERKYLKHVKPAPLQTPPAAIVRQRKHSLSACEKFKKCQSETENDSDETALSKTWSVFSKSSLDQGQYSTEDDIY